jgi:hypothetical protein
MSWRHENGIPIWEPMSLDDISNRNEEITWLKNHERRNWKLVNGRIARSGDPVNMPQGPYGAAIVNPPAQSLAAVTGGTANVAWWSSALYTPLAANSVIAPEAYKLWAAGLVTSSGAGQTITPSANVGTAVGTALGAGVALALASTITGAHWIMQGICTVRAGGTAGIMQGRFWLAFSPTAGAGTNLIHGLWGANQTAIDFTAAQV